MQQRIWKYDVIERLMADPDHSLSVALEWLCRVVHSNTGVIYLREHNAKEEHCVFFSGRRRRIVRCMEAAEVDRVYLEAAREACHLNRVREEPEGLHAYPLTCEEAEDFGGISFHQGNVTEPERFKKAITLFSRAIYHQLLSNLLEKRNETAMLRGENLCMNYYPDGMQPNTVDQVSFSIHREQFTVIMGRSGSGKSTLLNMIGGMLTPTAGKLLWNGKDIAAFNRKQKILYRRESLGFIFQNYNLIHDLTALENVQVATALVKKSDSPERMLERVGLGAKLSSYPSHMSGGEQQRVAIARALVKRPEILLCDEPTGALDTENARNIMILLQKITRQRKIAVVMVTHNPEFIPLADHYIEMENGKIRKDIYQPFPYAAEDLL